MSETINVALKKDLHRRIGEYTKKPETYSEGIERAFTESDHIDALKGIVEKTSDEIEKGKKSGHMRFSVADELIRAVRQFVADVEQR